MNKELKMGHIFGIIIYNLNHYMHTVLKINKCIVNHKHINIFIFQIIGIHLFIRIDHVGYSVI